jgi:hypothetical protein
MYLFASRPHFGVASSSAAQTNPTYVAPQSEFDNDFDVYPPKEQIKKATVILVTVLNHNPGNTKEVIGEIVKHAPNVRFYYKVGDPSPAPSHTSPADCGSCEGAVVLFQGNPARMAVSYSYSHGQVDGLDGMSLAELRQLAQTSPKTP